MTVIQENNVICGYNFNLSLDVTGSKSFQNVHYNQPMYFPCYEKHKSILRHKFGKDTLGQMFLLVILFLVSPKICFRQHQHF